MVVDLTYQIFQKQGYTWKIDGEPKQPTKEQLEDALNAMMMNLLENPDASQISMGRVMLVRSEQHFDVYVNVGEL